MLRKNKIRELGDGLKNYPVVAILGPRQVGKTTLAKQFSVSNKTHWFDLEDHRDLIRLENPMIALENLEGIIIIDEVQRKPDLFQILRVLVDNKKVNQRFLILGSASRELIKQSSESLAGRIKYIELAPITFSEIHNDINRLLFRGGFPLSYLSNSDTSSNDWRKSYIKTFLEMDIPNLGFNIPASQMRRFWGMLAHYHGKLFNSSELGNALGISHVTVRKYLDILTGTFMVRELKPWYTNNLKKRQVKSSKIYLRDSGIYHSLMGIANYHELYSHPCIGMSWEGFAIEQVINFHNVDRDSCYFWRTQTGAELDLLIDDFGKRNAFEFKFADAPKITKSMRIAISDLKLDKLSIIYPGKENYRLDKEIYVCGLENYVSLAI